MSADRPERPVAVVRLSGEARSGTRAGDRRLRVRRQPPAEIVTVPHVFGRRRRANPALVFVAGFTGMIVAGALLLMLPVAAASGEAAPPLTALFTAASAVCVTGLVVVDTGTYWSGLGQAIILLLIQLGGLGFMTSSTLLLLLLRREATLRERILLKEALGTGGLGSVLHLARRVLLFTVIAESAGIIALTLEFAADGRGLQALWWGVFHAISAFNNAGFDVVGEFRSLTPFSSRPVILLTVAVLFILGGISYTAVEDVVKRRRFASLSLDTKITLVTTACLLLLGIGGLLLTEWRNPATLGGLPLGPRLLNAFFHAATPRTAGFNSVDTGQLTEAGLLFTIGLMFVGGAAGSTAGGIKVQTFSLLLFAIISVAKGAQEVQAFRRRVPITFVLRAIAVALLSLALIFAVSFLLNLTEDASFITIFFEVFSAFGTVGLSAGLTPNLTPFGQAVIIFTMFTGRLGPLTLVLALAARERRATYRWSEEAIKIG